MGLEISSVVFLLKNGFRREDWRSVFYGRGKEDDRIHISISQKFCKNNGENYCESENCYYARKRVLGAGQGADTWLLGNGTIR